MTIKHSLFLIIGIGFFVYFNSLFNGFVWDDGFQLEDNSFVQSGQFFHYFTHTIGPYYKPLMFFIYTLFFQLFHLNSFFYHFFQVSVHITNALFIFLLFQHFSKKNALSFCLALLFLIHPINEEAVVYIADYQDVLYAFFGLSALLIIIKQKFGKYSELISAFLLLLSLFSKETGMLFVIISAVYVFCFKKQNPLIYLLIAFKFGIIWEFHIFILKNLVKQNNTSRKQLV